MSSIYCAFYKKSGEEGAERASGEEGALPAAEEGAPPEEAEGAASERARAAIKEREREVQRALATSLRDRDKEREHHKRDEALTHFNALLADLVRNPELSWRDAKKQLKKDHRYALAALLTKDDKERLFGVHTGALATKRRDKLFAVLQALGVSADTSWRRAKEMLQNAPTPPPPYADSHQMEREFREYVRGLEAGARAALRELLQETRVVTPRNIRDMEAAQAVRLLTEAVREDARWAALEGAAAEREALLRAHVDELARRPPPPPPTATPHAKRHHQLPKMDAK